MHVFPFSSYFWVYVDVAKVDPWLSVSAAHMIGETVRQKLRDQHSSLEEVFIHVGKCVTFCLCQLSHLFLL